MLVRPRARPGAALVTLTAAVLTTLAVVLGWSAPGAAHNTFLSSDPADGAVLDTAPPTITMVFDLPVPLETATVTVIDAAGARSQVSGLVHGPAGDTEVVATLPALAPGEVTVRWRLVGADGHPITDRIVFTVAGAAPATSDASAAPPVTTLPDPAAVGDTSDASADASVGSSAAAADDGVSSVPSSLRWLLRMASYLAIVAVVGIVLTDRFVWTGVASRPTMHRTLDVALLAVAVLAFLQWLVVASDLTGEPMWSSFGALDEATITDAGLAFVIRIVVAGASWLLVRGMVVVDDQVRWTAIAIAGLVLLGTWAWAGHARSQRWPDLGVPLDVVHHAAAALWVGSLALVGFVAARVLSPLELTSVVPRMSRAAAASVVVIVVTGLAQSVRLVGGIGSLFDVDHGRLLAAKVVLVVVMLGLANVNRNRVARSFADPARLEPGSIVRLRRDVLLEFGIGVIVIGLTAAMVVSSPAVAR